MATDSDNIPTRSVSEGPTTTSRPDVLPFSGPMDFAEQPLPTRERIGHHPDKKEPDCQAYVVTGVDELRATKEGGSFEKRTTQDMPPLNDGKYRFEFGDRTVHNPHRIGWKLVGLLSNNPPRSPSRDRYYRCDGKLPAAKPSPNDGRRGGEQDEDKHRNAHHQGRRDDLHHFQGGFGFNLLVRRDCITSRLGLKDLRLARSIGIFMIHEDLLERPRMRNTLPKRPIPFNPIPEREYRSIRSRKIGNRLSLFLRGPQL